jgi:hypothetical protein
MRRSDRSLGRTLLPLLVLLIPASAPAQTVVTGTGTADDGSAGTLRWAIDRVNAASTGNTAYVINFSLPVGASTVALTGSILPPLKPGRSFPVLVQAEDSLHNVATCFTGTVQFQLEYGRTDFSILSADGTHLTSPQEYTFTAADGGRHTFDVEIHGAGANAYLQAQPVNMADGDEQLEPLLGGEFVPIAELGDRDAADQFHGEVRPPTLGRPGVEHAGDVRVVHHRQGLPLGLEPGDHLAGVHAGLDDLQCHLPPDRVFLLRHVDRAEPALADVLEALVRADDRPRPLSERSVGGRPVGVDRRSHQVQSWLRLAGQHVPAIYGPSGDVTWDEADPTYSLEAAKRGGP